MRRRLVLGLIVVAGAVGSVATSGAASAQPCEDTNCVTNPASAAVCVAGHAKDWKNIQRHVTTCFTQPTS